MGNTYSKSPVVVAYVLFCYSLTGHKTVIIKALIHAQHKNDLFFCRATMDSFNLWWIEQLRKNDKLLIFPRGYILGMFEWEENLA